MSEIEGENDGGRCTLCHNPLLWGGMSYDLHTRKYHAMVRQRYLRAIALMLRSKVAGRPLWR
jgi:hypothetical protein